MSASFTLSPPYKCNLYTISYNPTLALQGSYTYSSTYTNSPISIHNKYNSHDTHTLHPHTTTHTPRTHPNTSHSHPPHTYRTYIHYPKHPNLHPIHPQTQNTSLQHLQSFQPPPIYLLHSCTVTITLHQHMNTTLKKIKVSFENCKGVAFGSPDKHAMVSFLTPLRFNNDTLMVSRWHL